MGMSASQARLLTLTARLSDLELRAQQISNSKIRLSMESEQAATDYSDALNKKDLQILTGYSSSGTAQYEDLNYYNLTGPNSPLTTQYCLTDSNGNVLVTQAEADAFEKSKNATEFAYNMGAVPTTTVPTGYTTAQNAVTSTKAAYDTATAAVTSTEAALNTFGAAHVQGYTSDGAWSYATTTGTTFTTAYSDSDVFAYLASSGTTFTDQWEAYEGHHADKTYIRYSYSPAGTAPVCFAAANTYSVSGSLSSMVNNVTSDTTKAVLTILQSQYGSKYSTVASQLQQAAATAAQQTQSFYSSQLSNKQNYGGKDGDNVVTIAYTAGTNQVWDDTHGDHEYYIDINQAAKTFLSYFDAACANLNGSSGSGFTSEIGSSSTSRPCTGGIGTSNALNYETKSYNSTDNPDQIQYTNSDSNTAATYQTLLTNYKNALAAQATAKSAYDTASTYLSSLGTATVTQSPKLTYYTNLYDKMCDGFITMDNESSTLGSSAWIQAQLTAGNLVLEKCSKDSNGNVGWQNTSWASNTDIKESNDDDYATKAEAKYEAETAKIQTKDKKFDLELQNINTEHQAVQTEFDSVQKVIEKNIERSFKLFQA